MPVRFIWLVLAVSACQSQPASKPEVTSTTHKAAARVVASVLHDAHRFDCKTDNDCVNSCAYGAVGSAWYARAQKDPGFSECEDGCDNQVSAPPRCEKGGCVAYKRDPQNETRITPRPSCTRVER